MSLALTYRFVHSRGGQIPHDVGQRFLGSARDRRDRPVGAVDDRLVVRRPEAQAVPHGIDDEQVTALSGQFGPGVSPARCQSPLAGDVCQDLSTGPR